MLNVASSSRDCSHVAISSAAAGELNVALTGSPAPASSVSTASG